MPTLWNASPPYNIGHPRYVEASTAHVVAMAAKMRMRLDNRARRVNDREQRDQLPDGHSPPGLRPREAATPRAIT